MTPKLRSSGRGALTLLSELVIVVVGVYLGIALGNLDEARREEQRAEALAYRLKAEFTGLASQCRTVADENARKLRRVAELTLLLEGEEERSQADLIALVTDLNSTNLPIFSSGTYAEMVATGSLGLFPEGDLLSSLVSYDQLANALMDLFPTLTDQVSPAAELLETYLSYETRLDDGGPSRNVVGVDFDGMRADLELQAAMALYYNY